MESLKDIQDLLMNEQKAFFQRLGKRIAELRQEQGLSQRQLAGLLNLSQQIVASYETGERQIPVWRLLNLSEVLGVGAATLLSDAKPARKPGPAPKVQRLVEQVYQLPKSRQKFVVDMIENALQVR